MFNIGSGEMVVIFLLALLVLGPERLPKAMGQVGRAVAQMRKLSGGFQDEIRRAMDPIEAPFRPGQETLKGPMPSVTDEVRVVSTDDGDPGAATNTPAQGEPAFPDQADPGPDPVVDLAKASEPTDGPDLAKRPDRATTDDLADRPGLVEGPVTDDPAAADDTAVEPETQALVVDDHPDPTPPARGNVTPLRPRTPPTEADGDDDGDRATG